VEVPIQTTPAHRVLVVDDELTIRELVAKALAHEGFQCDTAADGGQARQMMATTRYDVVITDLRMPVLHGHALAVEILAKPESDRPVLIVLTGFPEPRLAKDLLSRGVDDVVFKPVNFGVFAAKVRALAQKRQAEREASQTTANAEHDDGQEAEILPRELYYQRVEEMLEVPPLSPAVLDVFRMAQSEDGDAEQLAANVARDASLAAEILRLANSSFHNPTGRHIGELREAVSRLGRRRIASLALARHALFMTSSAGDLLDLRLAWRQSVGAGVAIELLVDAGGHKECGDRLFLCSVMHALGRLMLMSLFPAIYRRLLARCRMNEETLRSAEAVVFPESHTQTLRRVLEHWGVPTPVVLPLASSDDDFSQIARLDDPLRQHVELIKTAALIGRIAAGACESWDEIAFPSHRALQRLRLTRDDLAAIVQQTRADADKLCEVRRSKSKPEVFSAPPHATFAATRQVGYWQPATDDMDWLVHLLPIMGIVPVPQSRGQLKPGGARILVNCLNAHPDEVLRQVDPQGVLIVADRDEALRIPSDTQSVLIPSSFSRLHSSIRKISSPVDQIVPMPAAGAVNPSCDLTV
jgi:HD-like signal output (HDOD) protein/CheY-like chemotaxis protein